MRDAAVPDPLGAFEPARARVTDPVGRGEEIRLVPIVIGIDYRANDLANR